MKKLKLGIQNLEGIEILSRKQLREIFGGNFFDGSSNCSYRDDCPTGQACVMEFGVYQCKEVASGTDCDSNSQCGNGSYCVAVFIPPTGDLEDPTNNGYFTNQCS